MHSTAELISRELSCDLQSKVLVPQLLVWCAAFKLVSAIKVL